MAPRLCKYECGTMLEGFDEVNRKYLEAGTGGLHTKERCQEAKAKLEQKNDHGNELVQQMENVRKRTPDLFEALAKDDQSFIVDSNHDKKYVDHTLKPKLKIKTFFDPTPEGLDLQVNNFIDTHNVRHGQYQMAGSLYSTQVWYEESK